MSKICNKCGLPTALCVCETIAKESQTIQIRIVKKKFGKKYTQINGINQGEVDMKELTKALKSKFACGGTSKDGTIELQGDHLKNIRDALSSLGFVPDQIKIK